MPLPNRKFFGGGFVLVEFAIALPLLILLGWGLATVSVNIFKLGRMQLADYVLETEAQFAMQRIVQQARAAKEIELDDSNDDAHMIKIIYHTIHEHPTGDEVLRIADAWETQYFVLHRDTDREIYDAIDAKRQLDGTLSNPITGGNSFGETKINFLRFREMGNNVLHISLEMESLVTERKIKISTAVFMPSCEKIIVRGGT